MAKIEYLVVLLVAITLMAAFVLFQLPQPTPEQTDVPATCSEYTELGQIALLQPDYEGKTLEEAILERRSIRWYSEEEISLEELSMLLWAGNGITNQSTGFRSAPSAGALYPIELYIIPKRVENVSCGIYHYVPKTHEIILTKKGEFSEKIGKIALNQPQVKNAAMVIVLVAIPQRTTVKYGEENGKRYILLEAGHIAQNILLEAVSLELAAVPIGAFERDDANELLGLRKGKEETVYMVALGNDR